MNWGERAFCVFRRTFSLIEDEINHWYKKEETGETTRSCLRIESEAPSMNNGFPRDGQITIRILNGAGTLGFRLSPEEALKLSTLLLSIAKEMINKKRNLWQNLNE